MEAVDCHDTGWNALIKADPDFAAEFANLQDVQSRMHIERAISLSRWLHQIFEKWLRSDNLDTCRILNTEIVGRATLQLDRGAVAYKYRQRLLVKSPRYETSS